MNAIRCLVFLFGIFILVSHKTEAQGNLGGAGYCCCYPTGNNGTPQCLSGDGQLCCSHAGGHSAPACDNIHCWGVSMSGNYATDQPTPGCTPSPSWSNSCGAYELKEQSHEAAKNQTHNSKK